MKKPSKDARGPTGDRGFCRDSMGIYREKSLHAALKQLYLGPGDAAEVELQGFLVDILRGDEVVEIQTGSFASLKTKLAALLPVRAVRIVYPVAAERWIRTVSADGEVLSRRKSPRHGRLFDVFDQLVYIAELAAHPNFSLDVVIVRDEETRIQDGLGSWRRKGVSLGDRQLIEVIETRQFEQTEDFVKLLSPVDGDIFTCNEAAEALRVKVPVARKMLYTMRKMGLVETANRHERRLSFRRAHAQPDSSQD